MKSNVLDELPDIYGQFLRTAREKFSWRPGSQRLLFVIANCVPQEPENTESGTHYNWRNECAELNKMEVNVYGVEVRQGQDMVADFHMEIATLTGGCAKPLKLEDCFDFVLMVWYYMKLKK